MDEKKLQELRNLKLALEEKLISEEEFLQKKRDVLEGEQRVFVAEKEDYQRRIIQQKFDIIFIELRLLKNKIYETSWWTLGLMHKYSVEDLLRSEHIDRVRTIADKINDDLQHWNAAGKLTPAGQNAYNTSRDRVDEEQHRICREIQERKPTFIEGILELVIGAFQVIMQHMPPFIRMLPIWFVKALPLSIQGFLRGAQKLLSEPK